MNLSLIRKVFTEVSTVGSLYLDNVWECFCLEDAVREGPKVPGKTAIPEGRYKVVIDYSVRFQRLMPHVLDVPGFTGIRIHSGNSEKDVSGCIVVGQTKGENWIGQSRAAYALLYAKLRTALQIGEVWLTISSGTSEEPKEQHEPETVET